MDWSKETALDEIMLVKNKLKDLFIKYQTSYYSDISLRNNEHYVKSIGEICKKIEETEKELINMINTYYRNSKSTFNITRLTTNFGKPVVNTLGPASPVYKGPINDLSNSSKQYPYTMNYFDVDLEADGALHKDDIYYSTGIDNIENILDKVCDYYADLYFFKQKSPLIISIDKMLEDRDMNVSVVHIFFFDNDTGKWKTFTNDEIQKRLNERWPYYEIEVR